MSDYDNHGVDPLDPDGEYWDPMDQPGAGVCGHCGAYPIMEGDEHDCPERSDDE